MRELEYATESRITWFKRWVSLTYAKGTAKVCIDIEHNWGYFCAFENFFSFLIPSRLMYASWWDKSKTRRPMCCSGSLPLLYHIKCSSPRCGLEKESWEGLCWKCMEVLLLTKRKRLKMWKGYSFDSLGWASLLATAPCLEALCCTWSTMVQ